MLPGILGKRLNGCQFVEQLPPLFLVSTPGWRMLSVELTVEHLGANV